MSTSSAQSACAEAAIAGVERDFAGMGAMVRLSDAQFWRAHAELEEETPIPRFDGLAALEGGDIVLGFLGRSHLGDVVCMSGLVRRLTECYGCRVYCVRHRATLAVLDANPFLAGFRNEDRVALNDCAHGPGHITQKLERAFGLPISPFPKGEIYLTNEELEWSWQLRSILPRNRPVAVVCVGSLSDNRIVPSSSLGWQDYVKVLAKDFSVIQIAVTSIAVVEGLTRLADSHRSAWRPDSILDDCIVLENLAPREFFSVFAIADLFLGTNTGAMHVAAAFEVPSIVVLSSRQYAHAPTFPDRIQGNRWRHESFLYPYHGFLMVD
ncbi:MAG: hypothetical protein KJZ69_18895 [Phycisphaerales bacterium]|nr:hypothetical protein [Phycisphaerales bacterium]